LTAGKLADFVMLDRDILTVPAAEIRAAQVLMTIIGGRIIYENKAE
jgi:predicted amidohydrolase YtcJ